MSPASQGVLEVERYIGSNLISSCARINNSKNKEKCRKSEGKPVLQRANAKQTLGEAFRHHHNHHHHHHHHHGGSRQSYPTPSTVCPPCVRRGKAGAGAFGAPGWSPVPLASVFEDGKKKRQQYQELNVAGDDDSILRTPLSRLAIHTQGAPLILSGRYYNGRKNQSRDGQVQNSGGDLVGRRSNKYKDGHSHARGGTSDCLSVASDESSGSSGHSENCLPRIIKPRKRRKKDRKPSADNYADEDSKKNGQAVPKTVPDAKADAEGTATPRDETLRKCDIKPNAAVLKPMFSDGSRAEGASEDECHGPELHHTFDDVTESESPPYGCLPSSCQCRYCDPAGIWRPPSGFFSYGTLHSSPYPDFAGSVRGFAHSDLALRRSWSEPVPEPRGDPKDVDGAPERRSRGLPARSNSFSYSEPSESGPGTESERRTPPKAPDAGGPRPSADERTNGVDARKQNSNYGGQCLEVSTEIVTSPDGHRDIEIRFYSTSPPV